MTRLVLLIAWIVVLVASSAGAVVAYLDESWHWHVTWLTCVAIALLAMQQLTHGARMERWNDVIWAWRRQDPEAWRRDPGPPITVDDLVEHIASRREGTVTALADRSGADGAYVQFPEEDGLGPRWYPLGVLRRAERPDLEENDRG